MELLYKSYDVELVVDELGVDELGTAAGAAAGVESAAGAVLSVFAAGGAFASVGADSDAGWLLLGA